MTSIATTALVGLFVWTSVASAQVATSTSNEIPREPTYNVSMTAYNAVAAQTDGDPHTTASGAFSDPNIIAARSADLADELPWGTVISVTRSATSSRNCGVNLVHDDIGLRVIADSMHSRKKNQIDIMFATDNLVKFNGKKINAARALGVCKNVEIKVVGHIPMKRIPKSQAELKLALGMIEKAEAQPLAVKK